VENVAAAIALAALDDRARGAMYNVAEPECLSEMEWVRSIASVVGWSGEVVVQPADRVPAHLRMPGNLDQHWVVDSSKIRRELGYCEAVDRADALRRTIEWERAHPPAIDPRMFDYAAEDAAITALG
jgi:nucleoside-diphosphate-sugar epimerase